MNAVGMCALLGVIAGAAEVAPKRTMAITLLAPESAHAPDLEGFLRERAREAWDVDPAAEDAFQVTVAWPEDSHLVVTIEDEEQELARREVALDPDPGATKLTVWLMVKSAINRALKRNRALAQPKEAQPEVRLARKAARDRSWGVGGLVSASLGPVELARFGPSVLAWLNPWERLVVTLEVGYHVTPTVELPGASGLTVHFVPVTVSAGWRLDDLASFSAFATADVKIPVSEAGSGMAAGLDLGAHVQLHQRLGDRWWFLGRVFVAGRASRLRYRVDGGVIAEGAALGGVAFGVLWQ